MAQTFLSAKLRELDATVGALHRRVAWCASASHPQLDREIKTMRREWTETQQALEARLRNSRAQWVARLWDTYTQVEDTLRQAQFPRPDQARGPRAPEEKLLWAEYLLDFAVQAANHALLASLEAIDAQKTQQALEEGAPQ